MKCNNCGLENEQTARFCVNCGCPLDSEPSPITEVDENKFYTRRKIIDIATDKLFLIMCIVLSVSVGLEAVCDSINIINLLIMIFSWIIFANGRKGIADARNVQSISGTVYFIYIINYIASGIIFLGSCLWAYGINGAEFNKETVLGFLEENGAGKYYGILKWIFDFPLLIVIGGIALAAICIVFNIFGWQNIHSFIKSVHMSASNASPDYRCCRAAKNWLIAFAVMDGVSLLSTNALALVIGALPIALQIMGALLIDKHFLKENN